MKETMRGNARKFFHKKPEGVVTFYLGGVDISLKIFVPTVNPFFMSFQAEGVQFPLIYMSKRDVAATVGAKLSSSVNRL